MGWPGTGTRSARAPVALVMVALALLSGCATPDALPPDSSSGAAVRAPDGTGPATRAGSPAAPGQTAAAPKTRDPIPVREVPALILYSGSSPAQAAVATGIVEALTEPAWTVSRIDIDRESAPTPGTLTNDPSVVAAVGPEALAVARRRFPGAEIVFSQVLEPGPETAGTPGIRGVAPMPPPSLQFAAWADIDPGLKRIALFTSERYADLVPQAEQAAAAIGAELVHRQSTSDRETLYLFRRLAPEIDGLWLAPVSEILSTSVIDEMLAHAAGLDIGVLVFTETLLDHGGLISVGAPADHVAATVVSAMEQIRIGRGNDLAAEIPLSEGEVHVNAQVAAALGLPSGKPAQWVIRDRR